MRHHLKDWCYIPVSIPWCSSGQWRDVQIWLLDNVPNHSNYEFNGQDENNPNNRVYYFAYKEDAVMFSLRWL